MITGKELAQKILDQITEHPETHDQDTWVNVNPGCGTTRCIAGWAVALNVEDDEGAIGSDYPTRARLAEELGIDYKHWSILGKKLLGLDEDQADDLFFSENEDAPRILAELFDLEYAEPEAE